MLSPAKRNALVLVGYCAISFAYFGSRLLPHPGRALIGETQDPLIFVWSFAWWPHAIGSLTNPFVTHALYAPEGFNLVWTSSVPGLALGFAPVTVLFGPVVSYNLAAILLPALAAWTAFLLCRHLTGSTWASLVGGYLFGFSSYVLGQQLQGHLHMTGIFLLPLVALVVVRYVEGGLDRRGLAWRLALLLAFQLSISTELALTLTIALAFGLLLTFWRMPETRVRIHSALVPIACGYGLAALLASPILVFAVLGLPDRPFTAAHAAVTDPLNLVLPTSVTIGGASLTSLTAGFDDAESGLYLGLPVLLIVLLFAWRGRRSRTAQVLVGALLASVLLALGPKLRIDGRDLVTLPWTIAGHVPGLSNTRLPRLASYAALAAAVIVALWIAKTKGRVAARPVVLPALAIVALLPAFTKPLYVKHPQRVSFFADGLYSSCLRRGETVAVFPFGHEADSELWQAESNFDFRLAGGYMYPLVFGGPALTSFDDDPTVWALTFRSDVSRPTMDSLLAFAGRHGVARFVVTAGTGYPSRRQLQRIGPVERVGGVLVAPACGSPPLTARDLGPYVEAAARQEAEGATITYCLDSYAYELPAGVYPAGEIAGATPAFFVAGTGITCSVPDGYARQGFATAAMGVPAHTYPYYVR